MGWRTLYTCLLAIVAPFLLIKERRKHAPEVGIGTWFARKFSLVPNLVVPPQARRTIWLHAVSLGEMRTAELMFAELWALSPEWMNECQWLISTHTRTGMNAAENMVRQWVGQIKPQIRVLPVDLPWVWNRFFRTTPLHGVMLMEGEWYPNLSYALARFGIPWVIVNARMSPKSFDRYHNFFRWGGQSLWRSPDRVIAQDEINADYWRRLVGKERVMVGGQIKFCVAINEQQKSLGERFRRYVQTEDYPLLLFASTREGEEAIAIAVWRYVCEALATLKIRLAIVPRHPERFNEVARLLTQEQLRFVKRSAMTDQTPVMDAETLVWLGDSMGELIAYYQGASVVVMGGSLLPYGGQNPLEAFAVGVPLVFGAHTYNFAQIRENAVNQGAGLGVRPDETLIPALGERIKSLIQNPERAKKMIEAQKQFMQTNRQQVQKTLQTLLEISK